MSERINPIQREALALLDRGGFVRTVAGWHPLDNGGVVSFPTPTMIALEKRGLVRFKRLHAYITAAGRKELRASAAVAQEEAQAS